MYGDHRDLHVLTHSFPTRRASELRRPSWRVAAPSLSIAIQAGEGDMRAHERPRSARRLLAGGIDQPRVADEHASPPAPTATLGDHLAALQRPGEMEVEGGGVEKSTEGSRVGKECVSPGIDRWGP